MSKRTNKIGTLFVMTTMLAGLTACSPEAKYEKQLELGTESLHAGDYETAITAFETAITLNNSSLEGYAGLVAAMNLQDTDPEEMKELVKDVNDVIRKMHDSESGMTEEEVSLAEEIYLEAANAVNTNPESELEILENGITALGEESEIAQVYIQKAENLIEQYLAEQKLEEAAIQAEKLAETLPSDTETLEYTSAVAEEVSAQQELVGLLMKAVDLIEENDWQALADYTESDELTVLKEKIGDAGGYTYVIGGGDTGTGIGYYSFEGCECDQWYYGEYVDGLRSGEGGWYWTANYSRGLYIETYEGEWSNDAPNGSGYKYYEYGDYVEESEITVSDGLTTGTYTHEFTDSKTGETYVATYEAVEGQYVEVEVEDWVSDDIPEDMYCYCIVYIDRPDGSQTAMWLHTYYDSKYGISHFRE